MQSLASKSFKGPREITIYIYKYSEKFKDLNVAKELDRKLEHDEDYWINLYKQIDKELVINNIKTNGPADGEYSLGKYVSLRNESFVYDNQSEMYIYPPDNYGFNAVRHKHPFNCTGKKNTPCSTYFAIFILSIACVIYYLKY